MAKNLEQINVVDIEATCWEGNPPSGQRNEVIEIGISVLAIKGMEPPEIVRSESIIVLPTISQIGEFCTSLTSLTPEYVREHGIPFRDAMKRFGSEFSASSYVFASWGDYDRRQMERQCRDEKVSYPFGPTHLNVKNLFALRKRLSREVSVEAAVEIMGWRFEGRPHRGVDDSRNIARLLAHII